MRRAFLFFAALLASSASGQALYQYTKPDNCVYADMGRFCASNPPLLGFWLFRGGIGSYVPGSGSALSMVNTALGTTAAITTTRASNETCQVAAPANTFNILTSNKPCVTSTGLRPEPQITNKIVWSQDSSHWTLGDATAVNNTAGAPDGTATANTITAAATSAEHKWSYAPAVLTTLSYVLSIYAQAGTVGFVSFWDSGNGASQYCEFNLSTHAVQATAGANYLTCSIVAVNLPGNWVKYSAGIGAFTTTTPTINMSFGDTAGHALPGVSWSAAGTETVIAWGAQLENPASCNATGKKCTSSGYIPTSASTVLRQNDDNSIALPAGYGYTDLSMRADMTLESPDSYYNASLTLPAWESICGSNGLKGNLTSQWTANSPPNVNAGGRFDDNFLFGATTNSSTYAAGDVYGSRTSYAKSSNAVVEYIYKNGALDSTSVNGNAGFASTGLDNETSFHIGWACFNSRGAVGGITIHDVCLNNQIDGVGGHGCL